MELCDRKKQILRAIVDDYIQSAEPIGSRTIVKKHAINLSPATIRNEMADLEEMGYLEKPHTSAGRIPSEKGYRFYVNGLMRECTLTRDEADTLERALQLVMHEPDDLISAVSDIVSKFTDYIVLASSPRAVNPTIKSIKLLPLTERSVILAVISSTGRVKNAGIETAESYTDEAVYTFSKALGEFLTGKSPYELPEEVFRLLKNAARGCISLYAPVTAYLFEWFDKSTKANVYSGGVVNIFNHPEYRDIDKAKSFIGFIADRDNIHGIISDIDENADIDIKIGDENKFDELKNCSVVISNYDIGGNLKGSIGVVGPMRMNYSKTISSLELITKKINYLVNRMFLDE